MSSPLLSVLTAAPGPHPSLAALRAYAAGELTGPVAQQLEAHTLACARCADVLEGLQLSDPATTNRLLTELRQRLHQRVQELDHRPNLVVPTTRLLPRAWPRLAAAAALIAGLGAGIWGWQHQTPAAQKTAEVAVRAAPVRRPAVQAPLSDHAAATELSAPAASTEARRPAAVAVLPASPNRLLTRKPASPRRVIRSITENATDKDKEVSAAPSVAITTPSSSSSEAAVARPPAADTLEMARVSTANVTTDEQAAAKANLSKAKKAAAAPPVADLPSSSVASSAAPADAAYLQPMPADAGAARTRAALPPPPTLEPMPAGGYRKLRTYLQKQAAEFEPESRLGPIKGVVRVRFTVSAAGKPELEQAKILRSLRPDYDAEVLRMLAEGPAWVPGIAAGRRAPLPVQVEVLF